jgi:hypothetical protein
MRWNVVGFNHFSQCCEHLLDSSALHQKKTQNESMVELCGLLIYFFVDFISLVELVILDQKISVFFQGLNALIMQ